MRNYFLPGVWQSTWTQWAIIFYLESSNLLGPNAPLFSTWSLAICLDPMRHYFDIFYLESGKLLGPNAPLFSTWSLASCLDPMTSLALRKGSKKTVSLAGPKCFLQQGIGSSSTSKGCFVTIQYFNYLYWVYSSATICYLCCSMLIQNVEFTNYTVCKKR